MADPFAVLASPARRRILEMARQAVSSAEVAADLGISRQASHDHLKVLEDAGILVAEGGSHQRARKMYRLDPEGMQRFFQVMRGEWPENDRTTVAMQPAAGGGHATDGLVTRGPQGDLWVPLAEEVPLGRGCDALAGLPPDPFMSGKHAEVRRDGDRWLLVDKGSTNGTFLNEERLNRYGEQGLVDRDVVRIGMTMLRFRRGGT